MKAIRAMIFFLILSFGATLMGCGGSDTNIKSSSTTMGQELMDLQTALDKGIITKDQYERAKKDILNKYR